MNLLLDNVLTLLLLAAFVCAVCFAANGLFNHNALSRLATGSTRQRPLVSILIPCRNEQEHIEACLDSILEQKYSHLEILVLDDHSEDESANILSRYANEYDNVTIIQGSSLPEGWTGKNWACHQLYVASEATCCSIVMRIRRSVGISFKMPSPNSRTERSDLSASSPNEKVRMCSTAGSGRLPVGS